MKSVRFVLTVIATVLSLCSCGDKHITVDCIWNENYSAFPSITEYQGKYYVAFREASSHIFDKNGNAEGKARVLVSRNGRKWKSVALLEKPGTDLRDPKLSVTPDGRLMLTMGGSVYVNKELVSYYPQVAFSADGVNFSNPEPVVFDESISDNREWIWRLTWHEGVGYGVTYGDHFTLVKTADGIHYERVTELDLDRGLFPGESTVRFTPEGKMLMMVRCENGDAMGRWGESLPPYTEWKWRKMDLHLGGPDFILLDNGMVVAGSRYYFPNNCKTMLLVGNQKGDFEERYLFPSGGDTSYPGFIDVGDELWMVYYSRHETENRGTDGTVYDFDPEDRPAQASIYLARIPKEIL